MVIFGSIREILPGVTHKEASQDADKVSGINNGRPVQVDYSAVVAETNFLRQQAQEAAAVKRSLRTTGRRQS